MSAGGTARALTPGEQKALVRQLVKAAGGVEACGVELNKSAERISQFQRVDHEAQMSLLDISRLEAVVGRAIVTGAAMRAAQGEAPDEAIGKAAVEAVGSAASLVAAVHAMDSDGARTQAEKAEVRRQAAEHLRQAQEAADAANRL